MNTPIYLIESRTRQDLAATFMRFQEYYESPVFKGRVFGVDDFTRWYALRYGAFTYDKDWCGFNIPAKVIEPFKYGQFDPLTSQERNLLDICKDARGDFYIIGVASGAEYFAETVKHEFAHGAFHINSEYREEVERCVGGYNIKSVNKGLRRMGYCDDVVVDETNAYVLVEPDTIQVYASIENTKKLREQLDKIFEKFFGFSLLKTETSSLIARTKHVVLK